MRQKYLNSIIISFFLYIVASQAAETVWKDYLPVGANPATYPIARQDWLSRVQNNFDRTRGKKYDLLFDGDSITDFWQSKGKEVWAKYYSTLNAVDFGISGDRTQHLLWRLGKGQVDGMDPKLVVLMIGTNNIGRDSTDQIAEGIKAVVDDYLKRCPNAHILLLGIFPRGALPTDDVRSKIADINSRISSFAEDSRVTYLDIGPKFLAADGTMSKEVMPDFLHPSEAGYQIWAEAIQPVIEKYFPASKKQ